MSRALILIRAELVGQSFIGHDRGAAEQRQNLARGASPWDSTENRSKPRRGDRERSAAIHRQRYAFVSTMQITTLTPSVAVCRPSGACQLLHVFQRLTPLAKLCHPCPGWAKSHAMRSETIHKYGLPEASDLARLAES